MKTFLFSIPYGAPLAAVLALSFVVSSGSASAQPEPAPSAFRALFIAAKSAEDVELAEISGERGEPQPQTWKFLYLDPSARGGIREIVIARGELNSIRTPLRGYSEIAGKSPLDPAKLKVDSMGAFDVANREAIQARVSFHWVDYTLSAETSGEPVWRLALFNTLGIPVATVGISAESGQVLSPLQREPDPPQERSETQSSEPVGGLIGDVRDLGIGIGQAVSDSVLNAVGSSQEFLTGERTIGPKNGEN